MKRRSAAPAVRSFLVAAALACASPCAPATPSAAVASDDLIQWFADLVKANNGKAFCAPLQTSAGEFAAALSRFSDAHPELNGEVNDRQAVEALARSFPCKPASESPPGASSAAPVQAHVLGM